MFILELFHGDHDGDGHDNNNADDDHDGDDGDDDNNDQVFPLLALSEYFGIHGANLILLG